MSIRSTVLAALTYVCGAAGPLAAEWGSGLRGECKDTSVPSHHQSGWDCHDQAGSLKDLASTFPNARVEKSASGVKLTFADKLFFASGSSAINQDAKGEIWNLAQWMKKNRSCRVRVEGHT